MARENELSIVIPAYNEERVIRETLEKVISYLNSKKYSWEVVVADDGSKDKTSDIVKKFAKKKVRLVRLKKNKGKGGALREGILSAKGDYVIFMDADLSVPLDNIDKFLVKLKKGNSVVIASRRVKGAEIVIHQPWYRESMGRAFTFLTRIVTGVPLSDFTCGFKGFTKEAGRKIFKYSLINRWAYDAEIMYLAKKYGYDITEVPIKWKNREDTRVRLKSVVLETLKDLFNIRVNNILGKYSD